MPLNRALPNGSYSSSDDLVLEAVNELLETIGEFPVSSAPTAANDGTVAG